jgi:hypothetical protein
MKVFVLKLIKTRKIFVKKKSKTRFQNKKRGFQNIYFHTRENKFIIVQKNNTM